MEQISTATQPVRSEDRRAAELEELRKKQLAKTWNIEDHAGKFRLYFTLKRERWTCGGLAINLIYSIFEQFAVQNHYYFAHDHLSIQLGGSGLGGGSQPVTMESWFEQQRKQTKLNRLQQKDATENLRNYKSSNINASTAAGNNTKEEIKKKEQEATELLRNYRAQPEVFMSHQVKKHPKTNVVQNKSPARVDVVAPSPKKKLGAVESNFEPQAHQEDENSATPLSDRDRSGSLCTADWSVISGPDSSIHGDRGLSSTPVNVDMSMVTGGLSNGADAAAGITSSVNSNGCDTPLSSSYIDSAAEDEKVEEKRWNVGYVTVSFGLLIHENDSPPEGTYTSHIKNDIVDNLMLKMRLVAEKSLMGRNNVMIAKQDDYPLSIMVQRDGKNTLCL